MDYAVKSPHWWFFVIFVVNHEIVLLAWESNHIISSVK